MNRAPMGLLSLFKAKETDDRETGGRMLETREELWRKGQFTAVSAGEDLQLVYRPGSAPETLPSFVMDFVLGCREFQPLEAHLTDHAESRGWNQLQSQALEEWLPKLVDGHLLISSSEVRRRCREMSGDRTAPPRISSIGFPTGGDRVPILARAIESFAGNLRAHQRDATFVVADNSSGAQQRELFKDRLKQLQSTNAFRVLYSGDEEKRRFAAALVDGGCDPAAVEFGLFDPLKIGFACGANRNALLLHGAGEMLCSVDDDVVCRLAAAPKSSTKLSFFSECDPYERWQYADLSTAFNCAEFRAADFLGEQETLLGRDLADLFPSESENSEIDFSKVGDDLLARLDGRGARVRSTYFGHIGDPGIPSSCYYLYYDGKNRRRLATSEAHYRSVFGSRSVLTLVQSRAIGDASVSPGMAMGLDHRELLPPFFPVLHAEDFVFGAALWQCCGDAVFGHLPFAIAHEPPAGKPILQPSDLGSKHHVVIFEFAHLVRRLILEEPVAESATAAKRMRTLGRVLTEHGRMPHSDFVEMLRAQILLHESDKIGFLERQLDVDDDAPEFWREDVRAFLQHTREALTRSDFDIPHDLKGERSADENRRLMQTLIGRYGDLLQAWPAIVESARNLRESGLPLAREL